MAIGKNDTRTRDQLAYGQLIIWEAQCCSGNGWLDYDAAFWKQAEIDSSLPWNTLHPGLQVKMILGQGGSPVTRCLSCRGHDHNQKHCALSFLLPPI